MAARPGRAAPVAGPRTSAPPRRSDRWFRTPPTTPGSGTALGRDRTFTTSKVSPPPPAVSTGGAKAVLSASATVTGTVKPRGAPTRYYFQYGRTTAYPDRTASASAGSGTRGVSVRAAIGSLSPRTRYHYRLVATNRSGT